MGAIKAAVSVLLVAAVREVVNKECRRGGNEGTTENDKGHANQIKTHAN